MKLVQYLLYARLLKYYLTKFQLSLQNIPSIVDSWNMKVKYEEFCYLDFFMQ